MNYSIYGIKACLYLRSQELAPSSLFSFTSYISGLIVNKMPQFSRVETQNTLIHEKCNTPICPYVVHSLRLYGTDQIQYCE